MTTRSEKRRVRLELSTNVAEFLVGNEDGAAMLAHCSAWLVTQPGFARTSPSQCKAIIVDILSRELAQFGYFVDDAGVDGIRLVDERGRQLPIATLTSARLRAKMKGIFHHG